MQKAVVVRSSESKESNALSDEFDALSDVDMLAPRHSPTSSNAGEMSRTRRQRQIPSRFRVKVRRMMEQFVFSVSIMTQKGYHEA